MGPTLELVSKLREFRQGIMILPIVGINILSCFFMHLERSCNLANFASVLQLVLSVCVCMCVCAGVFL